MSKFRCRFFAFFAFRKLFDKKNLFHLQSQIFFQQFLSFKNSDSANRLDPPPDSMNLNRPTSGNKEELEEPSGNVKSAIVSLNVQSLSKF